LIWDGWVIGGGVSLALIAADMIGGARTSPAQREALAVSLTWVGLATWGMRCPERSADEAVIVSAVIASCAGMSARAAEWAHNEIRAAIDRRAVAALEATREAQGQ
jgi:small neutral amino acid transporter SnatA (MarC family)